MPSGIFPPVGTIMKMSWFAGVAGRGTLPIRVTMYSGGALSKLASSTPQTGDPNAIYLVCPKSLNYQLMSTANVRPLRSSSVSSRNRFGTAENTGRAGKCEGAGSLSVNANAESSIRSVA